MLAEDTCRVLSIQSHVVSGYVGNKAAVFPLQILGFDVDFINSVQFSNHTGYPHQPKGTVLTGSDLSVLSEGLSENHLLHYDYLLTGYIGSESFLFSILKVLDDIKKNNPAAKYVCDPVLGDNNQYYVPVGLVQTFKTELIPRAYMITPNQFEAELLTGSKIVTEEDAVNALIELHLLGPEIVVLTSAELVTSSTDSHSGAAAGPSSLHCYVLYPGSSNTTTGEAVPESRDTEEEGKEEEGKEEEGKEEEGKEEEGKREEGKRGQEPVTKVKKVLMVTRVEISKIAGSYTGTGDATAALMLAWVHILHQQSGHVNPVCEALHNALATVKAMIERSSNIMQKHNSAATDDDDDYNNNRNYRHTESAEATVERVKCNFVRAKELQVVRSKRDIEQPPVEQLQCLSHKTWQVTV